MTNVLKLGIKEVWRRENYSGGYKNVKRVEVNRNGHVNMAAFSIGPRGGYLNGQPGFTAEEWTEITKAVEDAKKEFALELEKAV